MNRVQAEPIISIAVIVGILGAGWLFVVDAGVIDDLNASAQTSLTALVLLITPVIAAIIVRRFVTPLASPNLPVGTVVNADNADPTSTVTADE